MAHDSSFAGMLHLINRRVYANCFGRAWECLVEASLSNISTEAVNCFEARSSVDGKRVRSNADICSILDMCAVESKMAATLVGVVGKVEVGEFGKERARIFCERMESQAVENNCEDLDGGQLGTHDTV
jgi:hypothetical protein